MNEWKRLGFGCMRLPVVDGKNDQIDLDQFLQMADVFLEQGYRYFDTAYPYHGQTSEKAVGKVLVGRHDRSSFLLADKMPLRFVQKSEDYQRIWDEQLSRTQAGFFDYYLLHAMNGQRYEDTNRLGGFAFVKGLKDKGLIHHLGMSFHDSAAVLDKILSEHPELEFVQIQLNYLDWDDPKVQSRLCYETVLRHGRKVWVMEPLKGGLLANLPPEAHAMLGGGADARWGLRFVAQLEGVEMILSGMHSMRQVEENVETFNHLEPLDAEEMERIARVREYLRKTVKIGCTSCRYCVAGCPRGIEIPKFFELYNQQALFPAMHARFQQSYDMQAHKPSECIRCHKCAKACPQHLSIPELFDEVRAAFMDQR